MSIRLRFTLWATAIMLVFLVRLISLDAGWFTWVVIVPLFVIWLLERGLSFARPNIRAHTDGPHGAHDMGNTNGMDHDAMAMDSPGSNAAEAVARAVPFLLVGDPRDGGPHLVAGQHPGQLGKEPAADRVSAPQRSAPTPRGRRRRQRRSARPACRRRRRGSCRTGDRAAARRCA